MSDGLRPGPTHLRTPTEPASRRPWLPVAVQVVAVLAVFAAVGAGCGYLWFRLWDPPRGLTRDGVWFTDEAGLRASFSGVALYVVIAAGAGLVLGLLVSWLLSRSELATLAAVLGGSVLAAYLMLRVGYHLGPTDPQVLAKGTADGTELRGALQVDSWPPRGAFPFGALVGLAIVYTASLGRSADDVDAPPTPAPPAPGIPG